VLLFFGAPVYIVALVLLSKRKDYQPLKSRSVNLIYVTTIGNLLYFVFILANKILSSNYWSVWLNMNLPVSS
jgi:hypothetical protein